MDTTDGSKTSKKPRSVTIAYGSYARYVPVVLVTALVALLGFAGGVQYQKSKGNVRSVAGMRMFGPGRDIDNGRFRGRFKNHGYGPATVTAVSGSSITIQNQRTGVKETYGINSSTAVSKNDSKAVVSDIKTGDLVMVQADNSGTGTAAQIVINPQHFRESGKMPGTTQSGPQAPAPNSQTN
jgi:hypothetical protein